MKRLAVTTFVALYTLLLLCNTTTRISTWADEQAGVLRAPQTSSHIGAAGKFQPLTPPHSLRRIVEEHFVVESPQLASSIEVSHPSPLPESVCLWNAGQQASQISGRAPPSLI